MFKFIKKVPYWYLIAIPLLLTFMGAASNQAVLIANGDKFPVMANEEKLQKFCQPQEAGNSFAAAIAKALGIPEKSTQMAEPDPFTCAAGGEFLDDVHVIMTSKSHLKPLADVFDMHDGIYSIGDFSLIFGEWMWGWSPLAWLALVIRKLIEG
jgi:hypothetical protein